jgi:hypothetical protein
MKFKMSRLRQIVKEEFARVLREAPSVEDGDKDKKSKEKEGGKGEKSKTKPQGGETPPKQQGKSPEPGGPKTKIPAPDKTEPAEMPLADDPADPGMEQDVATPDDQEVDVAGDKSKIAAELAGKIIQSVTMEPKSKLMPGAIEIVITFNQTPDPFRILVPKSGVPKFFWKGLHNTL